MFAVVCTSPRVKPNSTKHFEMILFSSFGEPGGAASLLGHVFSFSVAHFLYFSKWGPNAVNGLLLSVRGFRKLILC